MAGLVKHSITIAGHRTSFSLEEPFWHEVKAIAAREGVSLSQLVTQLDKRREPGVNLSSCLRVFVLKDVLERTDPRHH
ncbi:MAG: ribbon-helix-helix domain-containing protein [Pseudomonadota bacterium]